MFRNANHSLFKLSDARSTALDAHTSAVFTVLGGALNSTHTLCCVCEQQVVHQTSATPASSSTATPSTSASTTPALKRFKFLSDKLHQSGSTDDRSQSSTCATMHAQIDQYLHELRASLPEEDAITFWRRRQAVYPLLAPLAQDLVAAAASQAYVERVFSVCGWLTAGRRNRLSKKSRDSRVPDDE